MQERARAVEKGYRDTDGLRHLIARYHPTHLVAGPLEGIKYGIFREDPDLLSLVAVRNTTRLYEVLA